MDSPKTLSSLTHTSTPTLSHTSTLTHGTLGDDGEAEAEDSSEAALGGEFHQGEDEIGFLITAATDRRENTPGELGTDNNWVVLATEEYHVPAVRILSPVGLG
ncbi:UNVERIFIED_CONTAM: hypothetical protein Sindi_2479300 [Sesamum indicum]